MSTELEEQVTELLEFLYACPVGLVELSADGTVGLVNPLAMKLLLPIAPGGLIANFFRVIEGYSPELRHIIASFEAPLGDGSRRSPYLHPRWRQEWCCRSIGACMHISQTRRSSVYCHAYGHLEADDPGAPVETG